MRYGYQEYEKIKKLFEKYGSPMSGDRYNIFIKELAEILKI